MEFAEQAARPRKLLKRFKELEGAAAASWRGHLPRASCAIRPCDGRAELLGCPTHVSPVENDLVSFTSCNLKRI